MLQDGLEDVYMFLDDNPGSEGNNEGYRVDREELPTGVITLLAKCYSPSCQDGSPCYSYSCPRRSSVGDFIRARPNCLIFVRQLHWRANWLQLYRLPSR